MMEKRLVLAVALSILVMLGFQFLFKPPAQKVPSEMAPCPEVPAATAKIDQMPGKEYRSPQPQLDENTQVVDTELYRLTFSDIGGALKLVELKAFSESGKTEPLHLTNIKSQDEYIGRLSFSGVIESPRDLKYDIEKVDDGVVYKNKIGDLNIEKRFVALKGKYAIGLQVNIKNAGQAAQSVDYSVIAGAGVDEADPADKRLVEVTSKVDGRNIGFKQPKNAKISNPGIIEWVALKSKYFSIIMKPFGKAASHFYKVSEHGYLVNGVDSGPVTIPPGGSIEQKYLIYAGPSSMTELKRVGYGLDETINYGMFGWISKFIIMVMKFFYSVFKSWGIAILLLSVFLNLLTFPLTMKSFQSMQKMQELHPQMEKLKVQHKGNPQKLNQEMMELYKKYKINPLSGCLPMLLQMPIFFALYQALMKSIELRCTKFLWIQDLSRPDAVPLPFSLPLVGNHLNILPLLMVGAMVLQQKMSTATMGTAVTAEQREQQKIMLIVMPVMFGFIFYNMPSGLVLYWVTNTILTVIEQRAMVKKA